MIRSSYPGLDEVSCAIQGFVGAHIINALYGKALNPLNAAVCLGGIAFVEKLIYQLSLRVIPGSTVLLGPIPIGTKNLVSYGLATYITFKIMELGGLILRIPQGVNIAGLICASALAVGGIKALIQYHLEPLQL